MSPASFSMLPRHLCRFRRLLGATGLNLKGGTKGSRLGMVDKTLNSWLISCIDTEPCASGVGRHVLSPWADCPTL